MKGPTEREHSYAQKIVIDYLLSFSVHIFMSCFAEKAKKFLPQKCNICRCYYVLRRLEEALFHDRPPLPLLQPVR
jgi:hypothetical protein